jgi:DNA-binding LacI/PurR family transcriptional regulator
MRDACRIDWADQVMPDNDAVGEMAFDYFRKRDINNVLVYSTLPTHQSFQRRIRAFEQAATEAGARCASILGGKDRDAPTMLRAALKKQARPGGIFCPGDESEIAAVCAILREAGLEPMKDIAVIGCANDIIGLRTAHPDLPNIDIQPAAIGRTAAERLLWRLDNPKEQAVPHSP